MLNRYLRYCNVDIHTEDVLHLIHCPDVDDEEENQLLKQLIVDKILVFTHGWFLLGSGVFCNPRYFLQECFFTQRDDCVKYINFNYGRVMYSTRLCKSEAI